LQKARDFPVLSEDVGVVEAPPDQVCAILQDLFGTSPASTMARHDGERCSCRVEGAWWYRGEYFVNVHTRGALVTYRVSNIAQKRRWLVPIVLMQYRLSGQLQSMFDLQPTLDLLASRLHCAAFKANSDERT
jgi:hypothetical protein